MVSNHRVVCYEKREQSERGDRGGSKGAVRPWQGPADTVWEAKRRKVDSVVRSNCWRDSEGAVQRQAP